MTQTLTAAPITAGAATDSWTELEGCCLTALSASRAILQQLEAGAEADQLVPLLMQEREAVTRMQAEIARFGGQLPAQGASQRDEIATHLTELARTDEQSRALLSRRGVRLRGPKQRFRHRRPTATPAAAPTPAAAQVSAVENV